MTEGIVDEEEQFRRAHLRLYIDGDAVACAASADVYLVVRGVRVIFAPRLDDAALQDSVTFQRDGHSSLTRMRLTAHEGDHSTRTTCRLSSPHSRSPPYRLASLKNSWNVL